MHDKELVINWLKEGNDYEAAKLLETCDYSTNYHDTGFSLSGGPDIDLFTVQIFCKRSIYDNLSKHKENISKIESAIQTLSQSVNCSVTEINWLPQISGQQAEQYKISAQTISALGKIITGDGGQTPYRSGGILVSFFNKFLPKDEYKQGFPSRWKYAEEKITEANNKGLIKSLVEEAVDPRNFVNTGHDLELVISNLNKHLEFDGYQLMKSGPVYRLKKLNSQTITSSLFASNSEINLVFIEEHLMKCDKKIFDSDFSGAITNARSLVENILLELEEKLQPPETKYNGDINKLYAKVYKLMNLDPANKEISDSTRQLFSGLISLVNGLSGLRNSASDAHGSKYNPCLHHAKLAVNSAKTISDFLVESYQYQKRKGFL